MPDENLNKRKIGKKWEEYVVEYLKKNGYIVLHTNYRTRFSEIDIIAQDNDKQNTPWKGRRGREYRNEDHLNNLLNDDRNDQELNKYMKGEKEYKQKIYKDLLYSQFEEANNKNINLYGTNDPLILERKRKRNLSENPYAKKSNYDFSKSTLSHNPITDPKNNMDYNKYLRFSESSNNMNTISHINNINNNINNRNNFPIQNNIFENNMRNKIYNNKGMDEFKSNNYDTSYMNKGEIINNYNQNGQNRLNQEIMNNNSGNQMGQVGENLNNGYFNNSFRPTPSGERIRQAAASNFF